MTGFSRQTKLYFDNDYETEWLNDDDLLYQLPNYKYNIVVVDIKETVSPETWKKWIETSKVIKERKFR